MINKTMLLLTIILFFSSCSIQKKFTKLFEDGYTKQQSFKVKIPFEYRYGLVVIKVELNKENYDFVLDSGATNVLSKELAEKLGSKGVITINTGDAQGVYQPMDYTNIEALTIGGVRFEETATAIGDFNQSIEVGCLKIDGIIGSNLMRLAVWKIDYRNQIITIANTKESLSLEGETKIIPFYTDITHKPFCTIKINAVEEKNVTMDLGSNGGFNLSYDTYEKIQKEIIKSKKVLQYGYEGGSFYGYGKVDSTYYLQANELLIGDIRLNNQILKFSKSSVSTIGTAFFKNYDLVLNWADKEILLSPHTDYDNHKFTHKGITLNYKDDSLRIGSLIKESDAEKLGIQLGDKIVEIDGKDYSNTSVEAYCNLLEQRNRNNKSLKIRHLVINRNGEQLSFDLKNEVIIE